jgi:hypothetical protein
LIAGHAMAEQDPGRQRQHLLDEGCRRQAALASAEPIPVQPGVEASLGVAALIAGQGAAGGAGAPAGAGDSDRAGFAVVRREGQGGTVGLGSSHRRGDAGPALQPRRQARASHHPMAEPNVQPGWLVKPLPRRGAWKGLRHRPHNAADCLRHSCAGGFDGLGCAIGCPALSPSALMERGGPIRLVGSTFSQRHAPHSRRPRQPAGGPLGGPAAADPDGAQAGSATDPPPPTAAALNASLSRCCQPPPPSPCPGRSGRHHRRSAPPSSACRSSAG